MSSIAHLEAQLVNEHSVLLAYSGGLDSSVLLHQLVLLRRQRPALQLRAVHIHHGLSPRADDWVAHCRQQCLQWQVPLVVCHVTVDARHGGIEAAARGARYQVFSQQLQAGETLLTAQHQDDQSETLLLALKRGSGPAGLAAMPAHRQMGQHRHLRPLLAFGRLQLEDWAQEHCLTWIEDESNADPRYDRNFLRLQVMPLLNARWPHFSHAVARSASLCGEQEQLLDELLAESLSSLMDSAGTLPVAPLFEMSEARRSALLRRWIACYQGSMPSRDALRRLWQEVACSREDAEPRLRLGGHEVRRYRHRLYWLPLRPSLAAVRLMWTDISRPLILPEGLGQLRPDSEAVTLRLPQPDEPVSVRFKAQGSFHIVGRAGSRPLKKLWHELAVPPWERERTPLIFYGERLMAAAGVFVTREGVPDRPDSGWSVDWCR
ncbi:tRNA lysidine(34) synthetase TilS [Erwinia persicina]|uniref:tRNA lysidine(34) synthetase TilS n=1 Tax=Erwinia persicina TaxID=55211 RepID=UPI000788FA86|nr:tRNA lysidine(34) synthetase TilS [Erwinia persicina]MCQ4093993.1 tRNA lysidine(34) synthetase TilS [Erwinia persicina]MCQ4100782.1 tRNA lysidine(34) synthetase TilS [Erwinia persicina]HBH63847.1 tRNA(Ile)-lysidine synthetase [Erwinia persicina]HBT14711.1 tRNA(Ile)-lysidine synthetase [Erwinia persicina]